jgi:hypothetical protein
LQPRCRPQVSEIATLSDEDESRGLTDYETVGLIYEMKQQGDQQIRRTNNYKFCFSPDLLISL